MMKGSTHLLKFIGYGAIALAASMVAGILTVMVLAGGMTGEDGDIAVVLASALFVICVSGAVALTAAAGEKRVQRRGHP